ncbi:MAG TPA: DMT family transporter [Rubrivivax sp.]|nr:DMT family transporter [Rubrivivax sp.]
MLANPTIRLLCGAAMISFAPVFVRLTPVSPTESAFYRTLFGGLMLAAWVFARRAPVERRSGLALAALLAAGVLFAADLAVWHRSIWYLGPGLATLLGNFQVFVLALVGIVFVREQARWELLLAIPMAVLGIGLIVGFEWRTLDAEYRWGIFFGLSTALFYSAYILALRRARAASPEGSIASDLMLVSLVSAACLYLGSGAAGPGITLPDPGSAWLLAAYALVAQVVGWLLISGSLPHVPASRVGLILLLQPTLAFLWDVLIFARPFGLREAAGAALAIIAIGLGSRPRRGSGP